MMGGRLNHRITIEVATETKDAAGQPVASWSTFATVWADRRDVKGGERFASSQNIAERAATFRIRWRGDVNEKMRVLDEGATYEIVGIAGDRRGGWLELSCSSQNPEAAT